MDTTTASLITGSLGAGLVWWLTKTLSHRLTKKDSGEDSVDAAPWERTEAVYKKLLYARIASLVLCLAAAAVLFFGLGTIPALLLAGCGCGLQFTAFQMRTRHIKAVKAAMVESQTAPSREKVS